MNVTLTTSDLITIGSSVVSVASIIWAFYERANTASARKDAKRFRKLLLKQQISQQFTDVPKRALELFRHVRAKRWDEGAEAALLLSSELANLSGAQAELIGTSNKEQLHTALTAMRAINQRMPRSGTPVQTDLERELTDGCNVVLLTVNAIEQSLRVSAALGGDDDGK